MYFELLGNVPVLSIRREPLELRENRILKRIFDIVFSLLFLTTLFPFIYLIVGLLLRSVLQGRFSSNRSVVARMVASFGVISSGQCG